MSESQSREDLLRAAMDAESVGQTAAAKLLRDRAFAILPMSPIEGLLGKIMRAVTQNGRDSIDFEAVTGERWCMHYDLNNISGQCSIEDVVGDLQDLVGAPIAMAEESTNSDDPPSPGDSAPDSYTWTFYRFATAKGYVTVRWYGSSNGYYSERATFRRLADEPREIAAARVTSGGTFVAQRGFLPGISHVSGTGFYVLTLVEAPATFDDVVATIEFIGGAVVASCVVDHSVIHVLTSDAAAPTDADFSIRVFKLGAQ